MSEIQEQTTDLSSDVSVRLYYGIRAVLFFVCIAICAAALTPFDTLSDPVLGVLSGLTLLIGLFVALRYSKPIVGKAFGIARIKMPIPVWHALGMAMALAYAADGWNYLPENIALPVLSIAGTVFFGIPFWTASKLVLRPAEGRTLIQIAGDFTARKGT